MIPSLKDFAGAWSFGRVIDDTHTGQVSKVEGRAVFEPDEGCLRYVETGTLHLPGAAPLATRQEHLWRASARGIEVLFQDGRAFHRIDAGSETTQARHDCPPDLYNVTYDFTGWPDWRAVWDVRGPRKAYRMETRYWREGKTGAALA